MAIDHFQEHYYQKGRVDWNFNVVFNGQADVERMLREYAPLLDHPGLYPPIPLQWLHATVLRVGLLEDFTEQEMLTVAEALAPKLAKLQLPEFVFDSWWMWGGSVCLHITPHDQFSLIYDCVIEAMQAVVGKERTLLTPHGQFMPHSTLAYTKSHHQEREIHKKLSESLIKPAAFDVSSVALIKQKPINGRYEWEVVKDVRIG